MGGLLNKKEGMEGPKGKMPFLLPPCETGNRGGAQGRRRSWAGGAREKGENGEESEGVRFPTLALAGVERGGGSTTAGGGGRRRLWRLRERWGPIYRRGETVERRAAVAGGRRASR